MGGDVMAFTGPRPKTTARGLGHEHTKRVKALAPAQGEPCPFCHQPMWPGKVQTPSGRWVSALEADHVTPRALGGGDGPLRWTHRLCNRKAGSSLGARMVNAKRKGVTVNASRRW